MFEQLSDRLQSTLSDVRSRGKLGESDIDSAMRDIRLALLEADVNFKVVKAFTKTLKERCLGAEVMDSLDPGQQVVKIVNEELADLMGGEGVDLRMAASGPTVILMAGVLLIGLAQGAESDIGSYLISRNFDMKNFSLLLSFLMMSIGLGSALGSLVLSYTLHQSDSYVPYLILSGVGTLLGALAFGVTGMTWAGGKPRDIDKAVLEQALAGEIS